LAGVQTKEIPKEVLAEAQGLATPPPMPPPPPRQRSSSELSKAERIELLAQIEGATRRVQESSGELLRAEAAITAGRLREAEELVTRMEIAAPRTQGLERLKDRLAEAREREARILRAGETEQVLTNYLQRKQLPLARLALETLLEIHPDHPKRADYEGWIQLLADDAEKAKRAEAAFAAGREALAHRDFQAARRELETIARNDAGGKRTEAFNDELERAERETRENAEIEQRRKRFEELIAAHRVVEAREELDAIAKLDVPRITLDFYREQLAEARAGIQKEEQDAVFARRYRQAVEEHDWFAAREVAQELGKAQPGSPRAASMFAESERLEAIHRRQQAVEQGVQQVETFIRQGEAAKAELALKILVQMDPENRHRKRLEKAVGGMKR
ncbi:MAG TPA: hypothetical protein VIJ26_18025, partial [Thermoanaerobaculia bacterium]